MLIFTQQMFFKIEFQHNLIKHEASTHRQVYKFSILFFKKESYYLFLENNLVKQTDHKQMKSILMLGKQVFCNSISFQDNNQLQALLQNWNLDYSILYIMAENNKQQQKQYYEPIYLTNLKSPKISEEQLYGEIKGEKSDFTYVKGIQPHLIRRKMILTKYPQIANLLVPSKPTTIIIAIGVIIAAMANCYWAKDQNIWIWLLDSYLIGGLLNHTLHICVHDFTHFGGHKDLTINKIMAVLCNIPMGIPSAMSFGRYHSDHHNFFGESREDPDLPLQWQAKSSYKNKWYKYFFYLTIVFFYACRPLFIKDSRLTRDQVLNYIFIFTTNYLIYHYWGGSALLFCIIASLSSIGAHPAAVHIIAEHYQFVTGQQSYDYIGIWNFFNLDVGYHVQHHDFPNAPWYNLRQIRKIAPQFYEYLPVHTSYWKVLKNFLSDPNFNLFHRVIRVPPKAE